MKIISISKTLTKILKDIISCNLFYFLEFIKYILLNFFNKTIFNYKIAYIF